jgi:hypothetical protein
MTAIKQFIKFATFKSICIIKLKVIWTKNLVKGTIADNI